jgi:ferrous iron transport protein A
MKLIDATPRKTYIIDEVEGDSGIHTHLRNLGIKKDAKIAILSSNKSNTIVLLANSRFALDNKILATIEVSEATLDLENLQPLDELNVGETAKIVSLTATGPLKRRLMDMGITRNTDVYLRKVAPLGDPLEITIRGYELTLRKTEAETIIVSPMTKHKEEVAEHE